MKIYYDGDLLTAHWGSSFFLTSFSLEFNERFALKFTSSIFSNLNKIRTRAIHNAVVHDGLGLGK